MSFEQDEAASRQQRGAIEAERVRVRARVRVRTIFLSVEG